MGNKRTTSSSPDTEVLKISITLAEFLEFATQIAKAIERARNLPLHTIEGPTPLKVLVRSNEAPRVGGEQL